MPQQAEFPTPAGPTPTGAWEFIEVPYTIGNVPNGLIPLMKATFFFIESAFATLSAPGERLDLIDGTRLYRVEIKYLWRFPSDKLGHFIPAVQKIFRFQVDRPRPNVGPTNEWMPAGI